VFGISTTTVKAWCRRYEEGGAEGLVPPPLFVPKPAERAPDPRREAITALKEDHPEYGTRRIADVLRRFAALGVSESEVRRILHEEGLMEPRPPTPECEQPERRVERAQANEESLHAGERFRPNALRRSVITRPGDTLGEPAVGSARLCTVGATAVTHMASIPLRA
jgi:transposase